MTPRKPDRFERIAKKRASPGWDGLQAIGPYEVADLLRKEHAWMRRQIREIERIKLCSNADIQAGISITLDELEYRLAQRRK